MKGIVPEGIRWMFMIKKLTMNYHTYKEEDVLLRPIFVFQKMLSQECVIDLFDIQHFARYN